jgi:periplasmic protein TonB
MNLIKILSITFLLLGLNCYSAFSQNNNATEENLYTIVPEMPEFPGGETALKDYLSSKVIYPKGKKMIPTRIYVQFIVEKDGSVSNVIVLRGSDIPSVDSSAVDAFKNMPLWKPGQQNGQKLRVKLTMPVYLKTL